MVLKIGWFYIEDVNGALQEFPLAEAMTDGRLLFYIGVPRASQGEALADQSHGGATALSH